MVGPSTLRGSSGTAGSGTLELTAGSGTFVVADVEPMETPLGTVGFAVCAGLFCGICTGCACAVGIFKAWLHKAHIFSKAISRCNRLLLAAR